MTVFNTSLSPGQALSLETVGLENLKVGYARFTAGPSVGATAVFNSSDTPTGVNLYAAGVPAISRPLRRFSLFLDSLGVKDTGLAMVRVGQNRDSALPQGDLDNVTLRLLDTDFQAIATTSFSLSEGAQISRFIHEFFQDQPEIAAQAREMQGVLVVESPDLLAAITMRLTNDPANPTLTTFPVIEGRAEHDGGAQEGQRRQSMRMPPSSTREGRISRAVLSTHARQALAYGSESLEQPGYATPVGNCTKPSRSAAARRHALY